MNHNSSAYRPSSAFANGRRNLAEERTFDVWDISVSGNFVATVVAPPPEQKVWAIGVPVKSNRQTMLLVEMAFDCDEVADGAVTVGYKTSFVVEWSGWNTMYFTAASLERIGSPAGFHTVKRLRFTAGSATFAGTVLDLGLVTWQDDSPLIEVTPYEDMVVNFLAERMWDRSDWTDTDQKKLPVGEQSLAAAWMYANLSYLQKPGRHHQTAYTRQMDVDLSPYQAVTVFTATDIRANFSLILEIDGASVRAIDRRRGLGGGDEIRAPITGCRLTALTIELEQAEEEIDEVIDVRVTTSIRWILLERKGTDPAEVGQAWGIPDVPLPSQVKDLESNILPVGILIGRDDFLRLRNAARKPGPLKKMADEIIAEAVDHLDYKPERYVGRYLPVDLGNQGCERRVSPNVSP